MSGSPTSQISHVLSIMLGPLEHIGGIFIVSIGFEPWTSTSFGLFWVDLGWLQQTLNKLFAG